MIRYSLYAFAVLLLISSQLLISCSDGDVVYFYSPDRSRCITVITEGDKRFVINGRKKSIPTTDFVAVNTNRVTEGTNNIHICWDQNGYEWEVVLEKTKVIENRLDSSRFKFEPSLPLNDIGVPTEIKFRNKDCAIFTFETMRFTPKSETIVEFD